MTDSTVAVKEMSEEEAAAALKLSTARQLVSEYEQAKADLDGIEAQFKEQTALFFTEDYLSKRAEIELNSSAAIANLLTKEQRDELDIIEKHFDEEMTKARAVVSGKETAAKEAVLELRESTKGEAINFSYSAGTRSVDIDEIIEITNGAPKRMMDHINMVTNEMGMLLTTDQILVCLKLITKDIMSHIHAGKPIVKLLPIKAKKEAANATSNN